MRILIFGASGMLGNNLFKIFSKNHNFETYGILRNKSKYDNFFDDFKNLEEISDIRNSNEIKKIFKKINPDVVINCVGIIKQKEDINNEIDAIQLNSLIPHSLMKLSKNFGAKLIHFSTDCVFSGKEGNYKETSIPDADDIYGISKRLGEIEDKNALTLRTSIIGHELNTQKSLIDWFLNQKGSVKGYKNAIFSGLTTTEISYILENIILKHKTLSGLFHLSVDPISKFDLLKLVAKIYKKNINIIEDRKVKINRSLNSSKLSLITGYNPPSWDQLIIELNKFYNEKHKR